MAVTFEWDDGNVYKVWNHEIDEDEVEEAFADPARLQTAARNRPGERRWALIGATEQGRVIFVVYTRPRAGRIRVVTAYEAGEREHRRYRREKRRR